jgi:hypothetical protein
MVDATRSVVQDKCGFISFDLNHQGYKSKPFVLAKYVAQVFYVLDTTNKRLKVVIPENNKSSESRMPTMRKSLINLMRFIISSPR